MPGQRNFHGLVEVVGGGGAALAPPLVALTRALEPLVLGMDEIESVFTAAVTGGFTGL